MTYSFRHKCHNTAVRAFTAVELKRESGYNASTAGHFINLAAQVFHMQYHLREEKCVYITSFQAKASARLFSFTIQVSKKTLTAAAHRHPQTAGTCIGFDKKQKRDNFVCLFSTDLNI
jgi:hypothetical protein